MIQPLAIRTGSQPTRVEIPPPLDNTARCIPTTCYRCGGQIDAPVPFVRGESIGGGVQIMLRAPRGTIIALMHAACAQGDAYVGR